MNNKQYRLLWSSVSTSKKIKSIRGDKWFRISCHLAYTWMIPFADDDGRLRGDTIYILANVLPNEGLSVEEIDKILTELDRVCLIQRYEVEEELFIQINDWAEHQRIRKDRYQKSNYPQPIARKITPNCHPTDSQLSAKCPQDTIQTPEEDQTKNQENNNYDNSNTYLYQPTINQLSTNCQPTVNQLSTQQT